VLRIALNQAVKADLVSRNVGALATPPKVEKKEISPFTPQQAGDFLKAAVGHRLEALFYRMSEKLLKTALLPKRLDSELACN
jgi:hypothetical protein